MTVRVLPAIRRDVSNVISQNVFFIILSFIFGYLLFSVRLAVGNVLLIVRLTEPFFCVLRTTRRARPFHVFTRDEV